MRLLCSGLMELRRINRNIVECKFVKSFAFCTSVLELIETLWNVNVEEEIFSLTTGIPELIETLWNVNFI